MPTCESANRNSGDAHVRFYDFKLQFDGIYTQYTTVGGVTLCVRGYDTHPTTNLPLYLLSSSSLSDDSVRTCSGIFATGD